MKLTPTTITVQIGAVCLVFFLLALGILGRGDLEDARRAEQQYCQNVETGVWPHYNTAVECKQIP